MPFFKENVIALRDRKANKLISFNLDKWLKGGGLSFAGGNMSKFTAKQQAFIEEHLIDLNAI
ncbi:hypothetical protein [Acinetobacter bereziniae]|uniref:hypothetical protein n=1 Tax=Acinetobacter bereziniae TaxID=106648 RepID=UPI0018DDB450|nr:hypothetical protein [Acinetobacter bereziniae]MBI0396947.1 hypothetical protein [Acinetobacter bereziniae]